MSIITMGLDPLQSKVSTLGFGPDILIEITISERGPVGGRSGKRRRERTIRIRILDDEGKYSIQEQVFNEDEINNVSFKINEENVISGKDLNIYIKEVKVIDKPQIFKFKIK